MSSALVSESTVEATALNWLPSIAWAVLRALSWKALQPGQTVRSAR